MSPRISYSQTLPNAHPDAEQAYAKKDFNLALDLLSGKFDPTGLALQSKCHFALGKYELAEATLNHYLNINDKRDLLFNEMIAMQAKLATIKKKEKKESKEQESITSKLQNKVTNAVQGFLNQIKPVCESIISN